MRYAKLGPTDIEVSKICLGCMGFGDPKDDWLAWTIDADATREVVRHAIDLGINFFDTANIYSHGTSEEYLGRALRDLGIPREDVVIATKVYFNEGKLSAEAIRREIDLSLTRLGTDYVDLYIIHRFDYDHPIEETMGALDEVVESGKARAIGASAMWGYQFADMQATADAHGWHRFVSMQNHYNLLYREDERELLPLCRRMGVAITPFSPLASGHLTRPTWESNSVRATQDKQTKAKYDAAEAMDMPIVTRVAELAQKKGCKMSQIALAWLFAKGVTASLVGASKPRYLDDAVGSLDVELTPEEVASLEEPYHAHDIVGFH